MTMKNMKNSFILYKAFIYFGVSDIFDECFVAFKVVNSVLIFILIIK